MGQQFALRVSHLASGLGGDGGRAPRNQLLTLTGCSTQSTAFQQHRRSTCTPSRTHHNGTAATAVPCPPAPRHTGGKHRCRQAQPGQTPPDPPGRFGDCGELAKTGIFQAPGFWSGALRGLSPFCCLADICPFQFRRGPVQSAPILNQLMKVASLSTLDPISQPARPELPWARW